jgi:hypothetical protein
MATPGNNLWTHVRRSPDSDGMNDLLKLAIEGRQTCYFDDAGAAAAADYSVDVLGGGLAVHYPSEYREFDGVMVPTRRRVYVRNPDGSPIRDSVSVAIDVAHVAFS